MAEVESMNEGTSFGGVENTYIEAIDGPREETQSTEGATTEGETVEATEQSSEAATEQETETAEQPSYSKDPVVNELIGKFAKDHPELDPANPAHLKILNRMAHQEKMIRGFKATTAKTDHLTDFERSVLNPKDVPATETARPVQAATEATGPGALFDGDPGVGWKSPNDAYAQMSQAWAREGGPDFQLINRIDQGIFHRRAQESGYMTGEQAKQLVDRTIQERLGDVLPHVRETVEEQQLQQDTEFALFELAKSPEWETIRELDADLEGDPIISEGKEYRNSVLNRIIADNPEILNISVTHNGKGQPLSKRDQSRLTLMARFRAAGRIAKYGQMTDGKAKLALEAGVRQAERANGDRVRQGLNGGKGATGLPNGKKTGSLVHDLVNDGGPRSFSSF